MTGPGGTLSNGRVGGRSVTATHLRSQEAPSFNRYDQLHLALPLRVSAQNISPISPDVEGQRSGYVGGGRTPDESADLNWAYQGGDPSLLRPFPQHPLLLLLLQKQQHPLLKVRTPRPSILHQGVYSLSVELTRLSCRRCPLLLFRLLLLVRFAPGTDPTQPSSTLPSSSQDARADHGSALVRVLGTRQRALGASLCFGRAGAERCDAPSARPSSSRARVHKRLTRRPLPALICRIRLLVRPPLIALLTS